MMKFLIMLGQIFLLWLIYLAGEKVTFYTGLLIPGNVIGMVLLFLLLYLGIIQLRYIELAANFLLKHMVFFFIPITVGLMQWEALFYQPGLVLLSAIVIGALIPFIVTDLLI